MLHVAGALPAFLAPESRLSAAEPEAAGEGEIAVEAIAADGSTRQPAKRPRITKFVPKPRKIGTGYLAKAKPSKFAAKPGPFERGRSQLEAWLQGSGKSGFKPRRARTGVQPRTPPFTKPASPGFDKPWDEEKTRRLAAARKPSEVRDDGGDLAAPSARRTHRSPAACQASYKPRTEGLGIAAFGGKPAFRGKPSFGDKPAFRGKPAWRQAALWRRSTPAAPRLRSARRG